MVGDEDQDTHEEIHAQQRIENLLLQNRRLRTELKAAMRDKEEAESAHKAALESLTTLTRKLEPEASDNSGQSDRSTRRRLKRRFF